jgi:predicted HNH restriction endonuclease
MCQVCIRELYNTQTKYNFDNIQVHHIVPLNDPEGWDKRLDDDNLIALCPYHHSMAEHGEISRDELFEIVEEQERKNKI